MIVTRKINFYYQNVGGLEMASRKQALKEISQNNQHDVFILVETKLKQNTKSDVMFDKSYNIIRKDLNNEKCKTKSNSGLLVAIKQGINHSEQKLLLTSQQKVEDHVEYLWITLYPERREKINIFALYLDKKCSPENYMKIFEKIEEVCVGRKNETFLLAGNFNLHYYFNPIRGICEPRKRSCKILSKSFSFEKNCGLLQYNRVREGQEKMHDMVFCSKKIIITDSLYKLETQSEQHKPLCFDLDDSSDGNNVQPSVQPASLSIVPTRKRTASSSLDKLSSDTISNRKRTANASLEKLSSDLIKSFEDLTRNLTAFDRTSLPTPLSTNLKVCLNDVRNKKEYFEASLTAHITATKVASEGSNK